MKTKILVTDIDGTFLQGGYFARERRKFIPKKELIEAVRKLQLSGVELIFASGRRYKSIRELEMKSSSQSNYIISLNGAFVHDKESNVVRKCVFSTGEANTLLAFIEENNIFKHVQMTSFYTEKKTLGFSKRKFSNGFGLLSRVFGQMTTKDFQDFQNGEAELIKIVFLGNKKTMIYLREVFQGFPFEIEQFCSSKFSFEICAKGANKGDALAFVCGEKGIDLQEVAFTGDAENDISALQIVGSPIAMEDASSDVKSASQYVFPNVSDAIENIIKNNINK